MGADTHRPPSRVRYEQAHPTLSCRLDAETHELLKKRLASDSLSFADFVKSQLGVTESNIVNIKEAEERAYATAKNKYEVRIAALERENDVLKESVQSIAEKIVRRVIARYRINVLCPGCRNTMELTIQDVLPILDDLKVKCPHCGESGRLRSSELKIL